MSKGFTFNSSVVLLSILLLNSTSAQVLDAGSVPKKPTGQKLMAQANNAKQVDQVKQVGEPATSPVLVQQAAQPISLSDVLIHLRQSPGWRAADLAYRSAELQLKSTQIRAGLSVSATASSNLNKTPWDGGDWDGSTSVSISASISVLPWSPAIEAVKKEERNLKNAAIELRKSRAALTVQAAETFTNAKNALAGLELAKSSLTLSKRSFEVAQAQRKQNLITQSAVLERQAAVEKAQASVANASRQVILAREQLSRLLGRDVPMPAQASGFAALPQFGASKQSEAVLIKRALVGRPEVGKAANTLKDAQVGLAATKRDQVLPDLTANLRVGGVATAKGKAESTVSVGSSFNLKTGVLGAQLDIPVNSGVDNSKVVNSLSMGLSASYPLYGGGKGEAVLQAKLGVQQAELALKSAKESIALEVRTRLSEYKAATEQLTELKTSLTRAKRTLADSQARQKAGLGTELEVQQAEMAVLQSANTLESQQSRVSVAVLRLAETTAELDPMLLTSPDFGGQK